MDITERQSFYKTDICMIVHNDVTHDSRVRKEAASLSAAGWNVTVVGIALGNTDVAGTESVNGFTIVRVKPWGKGTGTIRKLLQLVSVLPSVIVQLRRINARAYHGHDFVGLLILALAGIWRRPVIYDAHELFFEGNFKGNSRLVRLALKCLRPLEKVLAHRAVGVITVGDKVAEQLAKNLSIDVPTVVRNAVDIRGLVAEPAVDFGTAGCRTVVHSGGIVGDRHLPELVEALNYLPEDVIVVLMGAGILQKSLLEQAQTQGVASRLKVIPPVYPEQVSPTLSQADLGAVLIASDDLNFLFSLPNKFFECVAAGLPIISSSNPEIASLVERYDIGVICNPKDPPAIAQAILTALKPENLSRFQQNVEKARNEVTWEHEEKTLVTFYKAIL